MAAAAAAAEIPTKEGWLEKRGEWGFLWARRYFRLTADGLLKNYTNDKTATKPKGTYEVENMNFTTVDIKGRKSRIMIGMGHGAWCMGHDRC